MNEYNFGYLITGAIQIGLGLFKFKGSLMDGLCITSGIIFLVLFVITKGM
jgi:hypothetical protein